MAEGRDGRFTLNTFYSDEKLDDVLKLNLSKGRYFSKEYGTDSMAIIINEEAEKLIGFKDILGKRLKFGSGGFKHVIGVVKNIRYESKHQKVHPMAILNINSRSNPSGYFAVRVGHGNQTRMINELTRVWDQYSSGFPFDYAFLDEQYDSLYMNEMQTKKVVLAIFFPGCFYCLLGINRLGFIHRTTKNQRNWDQKNIWGISNYNCINAITRIFKMGNHCQSHCMADSLVFF